ncbi:hypothetical protein J6590_047620 [Homalodisca vitripennis]|nr:hypothetical protein J6590_047620 [Homalodisca vitripennis]
MGGDINTYKTKEDKEEKKVKKRFKHTQVLSLHRMQVEYKSRVRESQSHIAPARAKAIISRSNRTDKRLVLFLSKRAQDKLLTE